MHPKKIKIIKKPRDVQEIIAKTTGAVKLVTKTRNSRDAEHRNEFIKQPDLVKSMCSRDWLRTL